MILKHFNLKSVSVGPCKPDYGNLSAVMDPIAKWRWHIYIYSTYHGLRTPNEGINQRYLKNWADVADKICFGRT